MSSSKKPRKIGDPPAKSVFFGQLQMIIAKFQPKIWKVAERVGFEPTVVLPTHAFQACALNHSAISPPKRQCDRPITPFQSKTVQNLQASNKHSNATHRPI